MCPRLRRPADAVGEVDGGARIAPSPPNQRYDRPTVARASRKEEHRPSQRPPSGVRPTYAGHRGGPLRYRSPRRLPADSGHPAASPAHPHPDLHLLTPQGGTFRPSSTTTTVNAMTESGVPSSRQETAPGRPLASTARPARLRERTVAVASCPQGCLGHLSLLRSANRRPLGRPDPSSGAADDHLGRVGGLAEDPADLVERHRAQVVRHERQSLPRPIGSRTTRRASPDLEEQLLPLDPDRDLPPSATLRRSSRPCRGFRR